MRLRQVFVSRIVCLRSLWHGIIFCCQCEHLFYLRGGDFSSGLRCLCVHWMHRGNLLCRRREFLHGVRRWDLPGFHWIFWLLYLRIGSLLDCNRCYFIVVVFRVLSRQFRRFARCF